MAMIQYNKTFNLKNTEESKYPIKFDITMLNAMIGYIYKETNQVTKKALLNMSRLFNKVDEDLYSANSKMYARLLFIKKSLDGILNGGIVNRGLLLSYAKKVNEDPDTEEIIENIERYTRLTYEEIEFISKSVEDRLKFMNIYAFKDKIFQTV